MAVHSSAVVASTGAPPALSEARMVPPATIGLMMPPECAVIAVMVLPFERTEPTRGGARGREAAV